MDFRDDTEIVTTFVEETRDHLSDIEYGILRLEKKGRDADPELVHNLFRAAHSIKAGANLLALRNIERLAHALENVLQELRTGHRVIDGGIASSLLLTIDKMAELVDDLQHSDAVDVSAWIRQLTQSHRNQDGV
jgi:chemotaxis protein histidine kinase CheA